MRTRRIVLVGHCRPDIFMMKTALGRVVPDAEIVTVNDDSELADMLDGNHALLVNRVLDGRFDDEDGIALIGRVKERADPPSALLVSNLASAQGQAVAAGASPGFGKSDLYDEVTANRLRDAVVVGDDE